MYVCSKGTLMLKFCIIFFSFQTLGHLGMRALAHVVEREREHAKLFIRNVDDGKEDVLYRHIKYLADT